ncbi:Protein T24C12.3 [Aphelenchoides avenae]|nr:Protein T24C12.3 [Aphelenchus avenae]
MDGNTPVDSLNAAASLAKFHHKKVWFEPTCLRKMRKIFDADAADAINAISPNINEFREYCKALGINIPDTVMSECDALADRLGSDKMLLRRVLLPSMEIMLITMGRSGVVALQRTSRGVDIRVMACPQIAEEDVISVSGAGDW